MSNKTIKIQHAPIVVDFDRWFGIYGANYWTKEDAVKVWEQLVKAEGAVWKYEFNPDDDDDLLEQVYFDETLTDKAEKAVLPANYHDEEPQTQACSASSAETLPTKNS
jgi:hypothetical protein